MATCSLLDDPQELAATVYDIIKDIRDPEKPETLEELNIVHEDQIFVEPLNAHTHMIKVVFTPTITHCSLATLIEIANKNSKFRNRFLNYLFNDAKPLYIGLCIRYKIQNSLPNKHKLDIFIKEGAHITRDEINKQINDKERVAAAMENPNMKQLLLECTADRE